MEQIFQETTTILKCLLTEFPIGVSNECDFLLLDVKVGSELYRDKISLEENMYCVHDNLTNMCWLCHLTQLCNMCLLDGVYCTFCRTQIRQRLLQIFVSLCSFLINLGGLGLTVGSDDSYLFSSLFGFLVLNLKFFDKFVYFLLGLLKFDLFLFQINFELLNTLSSFLKLVKSKLNILVLDINSIIFLLVHILVQINE